MKRLLILLVIASACLTSAYAAENKLIIEARDAVKSGLKDPYSAKFTGERVSGTIVCGEVNAKNSYGGYGGVTRYMFQDGLVTMDGKTYPLFGQWWVDNCNN